MRMFIATTVIGVHLPVQAVFAGAPNDVPGLEAHDDKHAAHALLQMVAWDPVAINDVTALVRLDQALVMIDPVGPQDVLRRMGRPDIVVLTSASQTHLSIETMIGLLRRDTVVLAPQVVIDQLPLMISNNVITPFEAGMTQIVNGISFTAFAPDEALPTEAETFARVQGDIRVLMQADESALIF